MATKEVKIKLSTVGKGKTTRDLKGVEKTMSSLAGSVKGFVGAFVGIAVFTKVVSGLKNIITNTIKARDEIAKFSKATGTSVEFLSAIGFAAERSGASIDSVKVGMRGLIRSMQDVKDGLAEGVRKFEQLGIAVLDTEGNMRSSEEVFIDVADRIAAMTNETEKAAIAQEIFGRAGLQLVPLLEEGSVGIENLMRQARELGIVFDQEAAVAAENAADAITNFNTAMTATGQNLSTSVIPSLTSFIDSINALFFDFESDAEKTKRLTETISQMESQIGRTGENFIRSESSLTGFLGAIDRGMLALSKFTGIGQVSEEELSKWKSTLNLSRQELEELQKQAKEGLGGGGENEITNAQKILDIQTQILAQQDNKLLKEQALLELKQQGIVEFTEEELAQQRLLEFENSRLGVQTRRMELIGFQKTLNKSLATQDMNAVKALVTKRKETDKFISQEKEVIRLKGVQITESSELLKTQLLLTTMAKQFATSIGNSLVFFQGMDQFGKSLLRSVQSIASQLAGKAFSAFLLSFLPGSGGFLKTFSGLFGIGGRADGGPVAAGQAVVVGERGPEIIIPDRPSTVIPDVGGNTLNIFIQGAFVGNVDEFAEEIASRSDQNFNRIKVNA